MTIDIKSVFIGMVIGGAIVIFRASVQVARDRLKEDKKGEA